MNTEHILSAFDRDLESLQAQVMRMGGLVEAAIADSTRALETRDDALAEAVRRNDKAIDALEEQINTDAARVIALRAPAASDLRVVLSIMKIASSLERMGDYAKNIAKRSVVLSAMPPVGDAAGTVRRMSRVTEAMLKDALDAYIRRDAGMAADVRSRDLDVDQIYNTLFRALLTHMMEDPRNITACMHLHFIAKNIERIGDHATSVAEQVIYLATGHVPEESRPKGDLTSTTPLS